MIKCWSDNFNELSLDIDAENHSEYWLRGGRGSGKSTFIARKIILGMLAHPQASTVIFRKVAATLRQSVYEEMVKAIDALRLRPWCIFRLSPLEIQFRPTGQRILFRGADDPGKSKSITLSKGYFGYLWFEELAEFSGKDDIDIIAASVIRGSADQRPIVFCSYNPPQSARAWVNTESILPVPGRLVHLSSYLELPPEWIGESFINRADEMRQTNERAWRHMYLGEITGTGGQVFENLEIREITDEEIGTLEWFYQGVDWGWFPDPFQWVRVAYHSATQRVFVVDEYRAYKKSNRETFDALSGRLTYGETIYADSAEPKSIQDWRDYGVSQIRGVDKSQVNGKGSVSYSMKWLASRRRIIIDPRRCPNCAAEYSAYEYLRNAQGEYIDGYADANNHAIDAVRYALSRVWRSRGE